MKSDTDISSESDGGSVYKPSSDSTDEDSIDSIPIKSPTMPKSKSPTLSDDPFDLSAPTPSDDPFDSSARDPNEVSPTPSDDPFDSPTQFKRSHEVDLQSPK